MPATKGKTNPLTISKGQIVTAGHLDPFTNKYKKHPFLVYKKEEPNRVFCFRITSQVSNIKDWEILIQPNDENNLEKVSAVCVDVLMLLDASKCDIIGKIDQATFNKVALTRISQNSKEEIETVEEISKYFP